MIYDGLLVTFDLSDDAPKPSAAAAELRKKGLTTRLHL
jgi:hypothetical protein